MVEKRTFVFLTLAMIVWAASASAFAGYYYLQNRNYAEQLDNTQNSLNKVASNYNEAVYKYDLLLSEYSVLYGNASLPNVNYTELMQPLGNLIENFAKNYTSLLAQADLNKTYTQLLANYEAGLQNGNVTVDEFGKLLDKYYNLFNLSALRELGLSVSEATTLAVDVSIDYGNGTIEWHNGTKVSAGYTLFQLTREIAVINYTYYSWMEPGHILVDSINNKINSHNPFFTEGYSWIWYYWNDSQKKWISGPVGCDAWLLKDGGVYKWHYEHWTYP